MTWTSFQSERLHQERAFHDEQAHRRALRRKDLTFTDDEYLDHETWIRPALARLGPLAGKRVLDFGCGHGMAAVVLARQGAEVTAVDLSIGYLREAQARAQANGVEVHFVQANGERLPLADASFDAIWGNAVLHHLDLARGGAELFRILRPGGVAVFCEPWGGNPLLEWARRHLPYPGKERTLDEQPLTARDVKQLQGLFPDLHLEGFQFLSMIQRVWKGRWLSSLLQRIDERLLCCWPGCQRWCRYVVLTLRRPLQ